MGLESWNCGENKAKNEKKKKIQKIENEGHMSGALAVNW